MSLEFFFKPNVIAVIGGSSSKGKVGNSVLRNLVARHADAKVYAVNPKGEPIIEGFPCVPHVVDIPEKVVDLAIVCIPARAILDAVEDCIAKKVKGIVVITAGFKEVGPEGAKLEQQFLARCKETGMRVLGPNCLGMISLYHNSSFAPLTPAAGVVAMISQSGAVMTGVSDWSAVNDLGFSAFISLGNKADVDESDLIEYLARDPATRIIVCYLEAINNGTRFIEVVSKATKIKPVIILKSGVSEAGARAASSHTGSLAGSDIAYDLAFAKAGVIRAKTLSELFSYCKTFSVSKFPLSEYFAIVTNAGGPGIISTDAFVAEGVGVARFSPNIIQELREKLPAEAAVYDPVDIIGDATPDRYDVALRTVFNDSIEACAGALVLLTPQANTQPPRVSELMLKIREDFPDRVMIASFIGGRNVAEAAAKLRAGGIPCYDFPEEAIKNISGLIKFTRFGKRPPETDIPEIQVNKAKIQAILDGSKAENRPMLLNYECSAVFSEYGIPHPKTRLAKTQNEARTLAAEIGFPVVMKIVSPQIVHKTDVGGVVLGIKSADEAEEAFVKILSSVQRMRPDATIHGIEVQEMINRAAKKKTTELIIGMSKDPQFGPLLMFGMGGIYVNFLKDVSFRLANFLSVEDSKKIIQETKTYALLRGVRGEPPSDIEQVELVLQKISRLVRDFPDIVELDINPLLAFARGEGVSAVDIKITVKLASAAPAHAGGH
ncbi:MAG: CoA-binding protein [Candidatus Lokiarchaeota archaeon]|nr:CoA-binding protein [Candidatus Lokiarchaeota archaeon]